MRLAHRIPDRPVRSAPPCAPSRGIGRTQAPELRAPRPQAVDPGPTRTAEMHQIASSTGTHRAAMRAMARETGIRPMKCSLQWKNYQAPPSGRPETPRTRRAPHSRSRQGIRSPVQRPLHHENRSTSPLAANSRHPRGRGQALIFDVDSYRFQANEPPFATVGLWPCGDDRPAPRLTYRPTSTAHVCPWLRVRQDELLGPPHGGPARASGNSGKVRPWSRRHPSRSRTTTFVETQSTPVRVRTTCN